MVEQFYKITGLDDVWPGCQDLFVTHLQSTSCVLFEVDITLGLSKANRTLADANRIYYCQ